MEREFLRWLKLKNGFLILTLDDSKGMFISSSYLFKVRSRLLTHIDVWFLLSRH